ncbi:nickel pincer cofactor biosynthesis protein LarB [Gorillibacterium timonense]|uniref:nickel pincer cofactor biosynthesis protein LarB n=1 Tax=Gorillibacterium timonense TaxID=1689269 RepID=UPI00071D04A5|nr:nickel pincer cofactor biosynthesis protein LarB [Gorillibacterium timonense]
MDKEALRKLLTSVRTGEVEIEDALGDLEDLPFKDLGMALIDNHREVRTGAPEVVYGAGKTVEQVKEIVRYMLTRDNNILVTRASIEMYEAVREVCPEAAYNTLGRTITIWRKPQELTESYIVVVSAGTSDLPVVEEAVETARILGNRVEKITDVGVAGIHRLFARLDVIRGAKVVVVVAGMEGALASVMGGLVEKPVIAVPTSVGYGANFGGLSALLSMLNSCASGVSVVNIDNGYGAACCASMINKL